MSILPIIKEPASSLRQESQPILAVTPDIKRLILDMGQTMKSAKGVGLAAPQIGQNIRLCIISTEKGPLVLINPKITWKSLRKDVEEEGCLSCPNAYIKVKRSKLIHVKALNEKGQIFSFKATGYFARVIQHEVDHLNGILIIDK
ncbi:MAG: peptide deformylase [Candidatus Parcubacteria bacterium]|nr:peptide deformylase [Candidatus Parcubacteria bacterium]